MKNKEFSKELEKRTKALAVQVIRLSASLPETTEARVIRNQITKSGSSLFNSQIKFINLITIKLH